MLVIVGGLVGYGFFKAFRNLNQEGSILLICADVSHYYSRPLLSTAFNKRKTSRQLVLTNVTKMADDLLITIRTHTTAIHIDAQNQQVCPIFPITVKSPICPLVICWNPQPDNTKAVWNIFGSEPNLTARLMLNQRMLGYILLGVCIFQKNALLKELNPLH